MTRKHVQLFIFAIFLTVASSISINSRVQAQKWNETVLMPRTIVATKETKDFPYTVQNKKNISCILANMSIKAKLPYKAGSETKSGSITVPFDAQVTGNCSDIISQMKLTWKEKDDKDGKDNVISFTFIDDHTSFSLFSINASIYLDAKNFPGATGGVSSTEKVLNYTSGSDLRLFVTPVKNGRHRCTEETKLTIGDSEFVISNVSLIAFNSEKDIATRKEEKCSEQTKTPTFPYVLKNGAGKICSLAKMSISFEISYSAKGSEVTNRTIRVPSNATVDGTCSTTAPRMILTWTEGESTFASNKENKIVFNFLKNNGHAYVSSIAFNIFLDEKNFPNAGGKSVSGQTPVMDFDGIFSTSGDNGLYSCANGTTVNFQNSTMSIEDVLLVAFDAERDFSTKNVVDCKSESILSEKNFNYVVKKDETSEPCILANMTINMKVPYNKSDSKMDSKTLTVPRTIKVTGDCDNVVSAMSLSWSEPKADANNTMKFYVHRNSSHFFVYLIAADIYLDKEHFPDAVDKGKIITDWAETGHDLFAADLHNGLYNCVKNQTIKMNDIELTISDVAFVAFNTDENLAFRKVQKCSDESDVSSTTSTTPTTTESTTAKSTTVEPTPAPIPTPAPDPSVKKFNYFEIDPETGVACTMANMTITLNVPYEKKNSESATTTLDVPRDAMAKVKCGNESSTMDLIWTPKDKASFDTITTENVVTFTFRKKDSGFFVHSVKVSLYMDEKHFPNAKTEKTRYEGTSKELNLFSSSVKQLYRCAPQTSMKAENVGVSIRNVALIAFNTEKVVSSRSEANCITKEEGSNVGAIIGGIIGCLAFVGLVWFGVSLYLKRRRMG